MNDEKNIELIKAAQAGNRQAFEALLQEYYDVMFKMAFKYCGNQANAEDITQNACIKLAKSIDSFRFKSKFSSWLYRLVINTAKDWQKAHFKHESVDISETVSIGSVKPEAESGLYARQVLERISQLHDKEKSALLLVFSEGHSHAEAAIIMECKESTVSWYIHEARKKLKEFEDKERSAHHG